jgi:hypothetical protein
MKSFRFTAQDALIAMTLATVWCAAFSQHYLVFEIFTARSFPVSLYYGFMAGLPATAVAALLGRLGLGVLCGMASMLGVVAFRTLTNFSY